MGFGNTGKVWDINGLKDALEIASMTWASSITFHHTAFPDLTMRPHGLKVQHIRNIRDYYENTKGWSSGPHLFTDEDQIWGMCPFSEKGVHARSFNSHSVGIEVLGNYDLEDPHSGRGLACWKLAAATGAAVLARLGIPINKNSVKFHRDDPKTSKTCPGNKITKEWVMDLMTSGTPDEPDSEDIRAIVRERVANIEWQLKQLKVEVGE